MTRAIGIDLGTTYSVAAVIENGRARIIKNLEGENLTPSVFAETARGHKLVGSVARRQASANPEKTVTSIKRHMGTDYRVSMNGSKYSPQEISAFILRKIKFDAENYLGQEVTKTVITVPAYFNDGQRQATREAGIMAGFDVMRIINEPTAASLAYGIDREKIETVLIWDLGGGTFDVSILEMGDGMFHVKAVNGNTALGGDDWDEKMADYVAGEFLLEHGIDVKNDAAIFQRLMEACEKAKKVLSFKPESIISLPYARTINEGWRTLETLMERTTFEAITAELREKLLGPTRQALADAGLAPEDVERVVLVGGSTRMPAIRQMAEEFFSQKPYTKINPDEVVAIGAAIQAGVLTGEVDNVTLLDVTPLSLGVETQGGLFTKIITRNSTIPTSAGQIFTNAGDDQTVMDIHVLQGERELAADNISLGRFQLTDIPPLPRGKAQVEVTFEIDVNGIVQVSASELYTEQQTGITINASHLLSDEEIEHAVKEAQACAEEDSKRRREVEINIEADGMIRAAKLVIEKKEKVVSGSSLSRIQAAILELKESLAKGEAKVIENRTTDLRKLLGEI